MARRQASRRAVVAPLAAAADREALMAVRACLVGFGSAGDIHPLLALGRALRERGHPVTLLSNPLYAGHAAREGLDFLAVGEERHQRETIGHPKLWHPIAGFGVMWRYLLRPAVEPTYERLAALAGDGPLVVLASPVAFGARLAQERLGVPLVSLYTAATMLRTVHDPMTLASWRVPAWFPRAGRQAAWALLDRYKLEPLVRPTLDPLRARLGLPPLADKVFGRWMHSPQAGLALFPEWFAPAPPDWPPQVVQGGFPLYDEQAPLEPALLDFLDAGEPPVVFMPGTARRGADDFFLAAIRTCEQQELRGVLLGDVAPELTVTLPPQVRVQPYAPFAALLQRSRALVHHGGIGSSAQALRAGVPQLVVPHAYDQFDNGARLEALGVGTTLAATADGLERMPHSLRQLLGSEDVAAACLRWSARTDAVEARQAALRLVEKLA
jgi:rhamnosyltransferase subunit B